MPSLYPDLAQPRPVDPATISSAPVKYDFGKKPDEAPQEEKKPDAALRFQPVRRPHATSTKPKRPVPQSVSKRPPQPVRHSGLAGQDDRDKDKTDNEPSSIDQWKADGEQDEDPHAAEYLRFKEEEKQRQRWANKKRKKKAQDAGRWFDFDQIYDPEVPTRLDEYKGSEEQANADNEWKARLHAHRRKPASEFVGHHKQSDGAVKTSAPPNGYNFAAPPSLDDSSVHIVSSSATQAARPSDIDDQDPYVRRMRLTQAAQPVRAQPSPQEISPHGTGTMDLSHEPPATQAQVPTSLQPGIISAAPVRYDPSARLHDDVEDDGQPHIGLGHSAQASSPPAQSDDEAEQDPELDAPRSTRPGQKDFAKRLLQKYGWQQGQGLGATGSGITTILRHQTEKRKKRPDAQGGGWATPATMGRIVGGKRRKTAAETAEDEAAQSWSIVALFSGMLAGLDLDAEMSHGDLMQTMGDKFAEYGIVERLYIDRASHQPDTAKQPETMTHGTGQATDADPTAAAVSDTIDGGPNVFVKFTSALSAYRAIQAAQDCDFLSNGRMTKARFWNSDLFEAGTYS